MSSQQHRDVAMGQPKERPQSAASTVLPVFHFEPPKTAETEATISPPARSSWQHLFAFMRFPHTVPLLAALLASAATAGLKTALAVVLGEIFDVISDYGLGERSSSGTLSVISRWSVILVCIGIGNWMAHSTFLALWIIFGELQATSVRHGIFESLLSKDMAWFDSQEEGLSSLLVRIQTATRELQLATSQVFGLLVCDIMTALASLIVALYYAWNLTLVLLATLPVSAFVLFLAGKRLEPAIQAQRCHLATASKHVTASITAIDLVKVFNGQEQEVYQYFTAIKHAAKHYLVQAQCNAIQMGYVAFWVIGMFVVGFWYGLVLVGEGLAPGNVLTAFFATLTCFQGLEALLPHWLVFSKGMSAGAFLKAVTTSPGCRRKSPKMERTVRPSTCAGDIELTNVSFAYPSNPERQVLSQSSFFFPAREVTFVVGRSGSGKSTIGNLIANFYEPLTGNIQVDGKSMQVLDEQWIRENITLIQQSSVLFNDTFFRNVAFGHRHPDDATKQDVLAACDGALLQSTISTLPQGLETNVGSAGHGLSGGQRQRLALARARLRDPPVLILDEVTSGLDHVTRDLVMDGIRQWRRHKTTIIITHDVSQIEDGDFVYVMNDSLLVQEGFKRELVKDVEGHFASLAAPAMAERDSRCPEINIIPPETPQQSSPDTPQVRTRSNRISEFVLGELQSNSLDASNPRLPKGTSLGAGAAYAMRLRLDDVWESPAIPERMLSFRADGCEDWDDERKRLSRYLTERFAIPEEEPIPKRRLAPIKEPPPKRRPVPNHQPAPTASGCREQYVDGQPSRTQISMNGTSVIAGNSSHFNSRSRDPSPRLPAEDEFLLEDAGRAADTVEEPGYIFGNAQRRSNIPNLRNEAAIRQFLTPEEDIPHPRTKSLRKKDSLVTTLKSVWPTIGRGDKIFLVLGVLVCMVGASTTPAFAYCFAQLLGVMTSSGDNIERGGKWACMMIVVAVTDGLCWGGSRYMLERVGQSWVNTIRTEAIRRILLQPKPWFERNKNSPGRISECLDRNAEEMRNIVGKFIPIVVSVVTMISIAVLWALAVSWKLTLVALALFPMVMGAVKGFAIVSGGWETKCNKGAEDTSAALTEIFLNIRVVRALTLEKHFTAKYEDLVAGTLRIGLRRAGFTCGLYGLYQSMGYALTSLVFYYGTVLLAKEKGLGVADVMEVINLLLFSIGTSTGILSSIPQLTMAQATASQMLRYANMPTQPPKGQRGQVKLDSPLPVKMCSLKFRYSRRSLEKALMGVSLEIQPGRCTAIVGRSGCGKSTILSILMGLYAPQEPSTLTYGAVPSSEVDMQHLRSQMAYVSQSPFLFPATVADNITYGLPAGSPYRQSSFVYRAADAAGLHEWIASLTEGYATLVGDGGQSLSGGQAQRLSIARALVRQPRLLLLDEPTSASDEESAEMIRQTIRELNERGGDMAVVLVTHSREMMRVADWIVVLGEGGVAVEEGIYLDLWAKRGEFARLLTGGEFG